jgi:CBS domain-containing protein
MRTVPLAFTKGEEYTLQEIITTTPLAERFEFAFNRIHKSLLKLVRNARSDGFKDLLNHGGSHAIIRTYRQDLSQYAKLRNSIVHEKVKSKFYIAEPHEEIVLHIEKIAILFEQPMKALEISSRPVLYYKEETPLKDVMRVVDKLSCTTFPIYDSSGYKWLLTSEGIIRWLSQQPLSGINIETIPVCDIFRYEKNHEVAFVNKKVDIYDVEELFEDYHLAHKKLEAVVITENGNMSERPLGIITSWDLVEIDAMEQS